MHALVRFGLLAAVAATANMTCGLAHAEGCGWHSGNYARTCSPSATASCLRAAKRNVEGFTEGTCRDHALRCSACLNTTIACARRADRVGRSSAAVLAGCQKCDDGFGRCMGRL